MCKSNGPMSGLWREADFLKFWTGETISLFGTQITALALPLAAADTLGATPAQMGMLNAAPLLPYLLLTLWVGVWVDRVKRRPILIVANIGRAVLLGFIPVSALLGILRIEYLYFVTLSVGVLTVCFDLAYQSYLPSLVDRERLVEGNSKLQVSASIAQIGGPGLAGVLIGMMTAPIVILLDAVSYLLSACFLAAIRKKEPTPSCSSVPPLFSGIGEGIHIVLSDPYLRAIAGEAATYNFFSQVCWAVYVLFMTRELHLGPDWLGWIMAASSVGALAGSLLAGWIGRRLTVGRSITGAMWVACVAPLLVPAVGGPWYVTVPALMLSFFLSGVGLVVSNVHVISLRQAIIPEHILGRVNACYRFIVTAAAPFGALLGGMLGSYFGLRITLVIGALGTLSAMGWILLSPVSRLREMPGEMERCGETGTRLV
ncbi:MFS transporter [Polycladomyces abyssicola]|uniref:MFS transporter n=1 Tax=Polycladomyces abyssicola TaxID=1125966 RepID=A0A8D5ZNA1_9BACL|nr:MFS transporter [Polycladomyces abyssicola]BCU81737.1 MFS transporter [Polycladomyces abyssicola]